MKKTLELVMQPSTAREDLEVLAQADASQLLLPSPLEMEEFLDGLEDEIALDGTFVEISCTGRYGKTG